ncbi:MAG: response regulator transcription factor [Saprospiraceae bacterium]|nr:response regulator transcription factor [Candidatus Vicinibacter proximus]MBL7822506.1 response regulator transcription factor [Saprospiraceae bacterium]MCC6841907.1 response regulator transcription factor [Saprospiraceae bacterium]HRG34541.1 response regulator transcription factor [Saprospiraceae bacterium]
MSVRIIIYEDSDHLRSSLCSLFQWNKEMEVMLAKPNPSEVLKDIDEYRPDVILMDIDMPVINGIEAVTLLRSNNLTLPIIMLTIFDDSEHIYNAICAGASGYLLKNDFENIISAIKDVLNGGAPMTGSVARKVLNSFARPSIVKKENIEQLTERENEILQELVKGCSYKMIADKLELSIDTIRTHIKKIYKKLQVNSATEAIYKITNK